MVSCRSCRKRYGLPVWIVQHVEPLQRVRFRPVQVAPAVRPALDRVPLNQFGHSAADGRIGCGRVPGAHNLDNLD